MFLGKIRAFVQVVVVVAVKVVIQFMNRYCATYFLSTPSKQIKRMIALLYMRIR